jgi:hypothetical protein
MNLKNGLECVILGGSNANLLNAASSDMGKDVIVMVASGWTISKSGVDALIPTLQNQLKDIPESVPIVIYTLDNSCFKVLNENGNLVSLTKVDKLFHVVGELAVIPFSLLSGTLAKLDRLIAACGNCRILILGALPRYFLVPCCKATKHCANVCQHDETAVEAGKKLLSDLEELNPRLASRLNSRPVQFLHTGDFVSGINRCSMGQLVDALYNCWRSDPVHGDKSAYAKIVMGLLDFLADRKPPTMANKRPRTDPSPVQHNSTSRDHGRQDWSSVDARQRLSGYGESNYRTSGAGGTSHGGGHRFY